MHLYTLLSLLSLLSTLCQAIPTPDRVDIRAPLPSPTGIPPSSNALTDLATLVIAPVGTVSGYSRSKFPHWITQSGACDTREVVLKRDGTNVVQDKKCAATSGQWLSPYDGSLLMIAAKVQIDHMVPLANAWRSGASTWTTNQRKAFANDLIRPQLWAVSGTVNDQKGDSSPDLWMPPVTSFRCTYAESWVAVKRNYNLTVTSAEKTALAAMLATC